MASPQVRDEPILEPDLPIIDPHHHLWCWSKEAMAATATPDNPFGSVLAKSGRYMLDEILEDLSTGHNVLGTVFVDAHAMYKPTGPDSMKSLGEVEWVTGIAAASESGVFGPIRVANGIVGHAQLALGDKVKEVLEAHVRAAGGRYRGIRDHVTHDPDSAFASSGAANPPGLLQDKNFRIGAKHLASLGLSLDLWLFEPQLPQLVDLARAIPELTFIVDHVGTPLGIHSYKGKQAERFPIWKKSLGELAKCPNVYIKVGGMGMPVFGFKSFLAKPPMSSEEIAAEWKPYVETCIETFGANRCMLESNYPVDSGAANYVVLWNAFKRITANASKEEKAALYAGTARKVYKLTI